MNPLQIKQKVGVRTVLMILALAISGALFGALFIQSYFMGRAYEMQIAQRLADEVSSEISGIAYADDSLWTYQVDRIRSHFDHIVTGDKKAERGWSVSVLTDTGELVFEQMAPHSLLETAATSPIRLGLDTIGYVELHSDNYGLMRNLIQLAAAALLISIGVFIFLIAVPFRALRNRDANLQAALHEAQVANKSKKEFLSTVSHELRTPLTSIKGSLELLKSGGIVELNSAAQRLVAIAVKNANLLHSLVNDILDIEKLESGKLKMEMRSTDIAAVVEDAIDRFKSYGSERGIEFVYSGTQDHIILNLDSMRIIQVVGNLLSNAAKFSPPGGKVYISVSAKNGAVRVNVKDSGCGISEQNRELIFEKFSQVNSSDSRDAGGTGLGLAIAKGFVEKHGGTLGFTSILGEGSNFYFEMPYGIDQIELVPSLQRNAA